MASINCNDCIRSNIELVTRDFFEGKISEVEISRTTESPCKDHRCTVGKRRISPEYCDPGDYDDDEEVDDDEEFDEPYTNRRRKAGLSYKHVSKTRTHEFMYEFVCACGESVFMFVLFELTVSHCPHSAVVIKEHRDVLIRGRTHPFEAITTTLYMRRDIREDYGARLQFIVGMITSEPSPDNKAAGSLKRFSRHRLFDRNVLGIVRGFITDIEDTDVYVMYAQRPEYYKTAHARRLLGIV